MTQTTETPHTSASLPVAEQDAQAQRLHHVWQTPQGWRYWSEVNNAVVGKWYLIAAIFFFLFGGLLALLIRVQLAVPENDFLSADVYNQIFTLHGTVMMFLFGVPIFEAFSIYILPEMLGARDLPFPRLSAYGFWCYVLGGLFFCGSLLFGVAPKGGWFMYPPLTTDYQPDIGADFWLLGLSFIEVAAIAAAVELIVGVLKCRPPGMRLHMMPLYAWYMMVAAVMVLFAFPAVIVGSFLLEIERAFDWPFFDAARGGDPLLWQHLFWIFGHPEVYIIFLPSIALAAMIVPTFSRTPIVGYSWIVLAAVGTGFLSFGLWVHHMFTTGLPGISLGLFSAASEAVAIPTGIQIFCFIATMLSGRVIRSVPMLFMLGGIVIFIMGGLTGVMVALAPFDFQAHDTFFVVAHLHSVLIGGTVFPVIAGFYYFYPLSNGKQLSEKLGRLAFSLMFIGFNVTFLPMHLTGLLGMPRRVYTYRADTGLDTLNLISSVGAFILAAGIAIFLWDLLRPKRHLPFVKRNPWNAGTLEWLAEFPHKPWGIRSVPKIESRYPLWEQPNLMEAVDQGRFYLPDAQEGKRETLVTTVIDAQPLQCLRVSGPSFITLWTAFFTGLIFIFSTFHLWWPAAICVVLSIAAILVWLWTGTASLPEKPLKEVGCKQMLPLYVSGMQSVGWWAMLITMLADITAFACLIFAYLFFWTLHTDFPPNASQSLQAFWPLIATAFLFLAWALTVGARHWNRQSRAKLFYSGIVIAMFLAGGGIMALFLGPWTSKLNPTEHAYPAIVWALLGWVALHVAVGVIMQGYCLARRAAGRMTALHDIDICNVALYWHFVAITVAITIAVLVGFPLLM